MRLRDVSWRRTILAALIGGGAIVVGVSASLRRSEPSTSLSVELPEGIRHLEPGWRLRAIKLLPERVASLATAGPGDGCQGDWIFVGTAPMGSVYRLSALSSHPQSHMLLARGMGDELENGTCCVNGLAVRDLDHDGVPELLASTCQIFPVGRPRLYVWSLTLRPELRGIARPEILSSWSHGPGFLDRTEDGGDSVMIAYCGHGEVVEYRLARGETVADLRTDAIAWKQVGQLPVSGEAAQAADADNDGRPELCVAAGFAINGAAIHLYSSPGPGEGLRLETVLDEGRRFGNVRFLVGRTRGDGPRDVFAWWCTGLSDGDCEFVRYRLGPEGVREREVLGRGKAIELWPKDGQMGLADLDRDGRPELWFATDSGNLWRHDPTRPKSLTRVLHAEGGFGPIASKPATERQGPFLLLGSGRYLIRLEAEAPAKSVRGPS